MISSIKNEIKALIKKSVIIAAKPIGIDRAIILIGGKPSIPQKINQAVIAQIITDVVKVIIFLFIYNSLYCYRQLNPDMAYP